MLYRAWRISLYRLTLSPLTLNARRIALDGLLLIDKPAGLTSHDVVSRVRRAAKTRKVGHTGTLDPDATGLLPITIGACTKLAQYLILDRKTYVFELLLGSATDTDDSSGQVIATESAEHVTEEAFNKALEAFDGQIMQRPPRFSAIRVNGKRAYELARAGVEFELPERPVQIERLEVLELSLPTAKLEMRCGSGTYVRSLVRDIGEALDTRAHTTMIRRTSVGNFTLEESVTLEELLDESRAWTSKLLTPAQMMRSLRCYSASDSDSEALRYGKRIVVELDDVVQEQMISVVDTSGALIAVTEVEALGEASQVQLRPKRVLSAIQ